MRHVATCLLAAAVAVMAATSHAQLAPEPIMRFAVPEANALGVSIAIHGDTVLLGTIAPEAYVFQFDRGGWWRERLTVPGARQGFEAVAVSGDVAIIGASPNAYLFRFDGVRWLHEATLTDERGDRDFGYSVDIDGELAVVGTRSRDVQVFRFDGRSWVPEVRLAPAAGADGKRPYGFAEFLAVDGERVLVTKDARIGDPFEGVYAFRRGADGWYHEGTITLGETETVFQGDVALDGDVALIDADYDDVVHVFRFDGVAWRREAILEPPELGSRRCSCFPLPGAQPEQCGGGGTPNFGVSVALHGALALVGANLDDVAGVDAGAAYLYRYDGVRWNYESLLVGEPGTSCGASFGRLVALHDGGALVRQGHSAYLFRVD